MGNLFDRSKFKAATAESIQKTQKSAEKTMPASSRGDKKFVQYKAVELGKNRFRVLPALDKNDEKGTPVYVPMKTSKLPLEVNVYDADGNVTGKEIKIKDVFCADIHGPKLLKGKDPVNTYISYVYKSIEDVTDDEERKKLLNPISGYKRGKTWVWGIAPLLSYICYIWDFEQDVWKLQVRDPWLKKMKDISIDQSSGDDDVLCVDIFSNIEEGFPLVINYTEEASKKGAKQKKYDISSENLARGESWEDFFKKTDIPDSIFEKLATLPTLAEQYVEVYNANSFKSAISGLERFDKENHFNIFANEDFLNEMEEMGSMIPEDDSEEEEEEKEEKREAKKEEKSKITSRPSAKVEAKTEERQYPTLIKMKTFLKEFIESEYEGTEVLPDLPLVELRKWYTLAQEGRMLPFEDYAEEETKEENEESNENTSFVEDESPVNEDQTDNDSETESKPASARDRLKALRERMQK